VLRCVTTVTSNAIHTRMIVLVQSHNQHLFYIDIQREQVVKVKVKVTLEKARAQRGSRGSSTLSSASAVDGVVCQRHVPAALSPGKTRYPLYRLVGFSTTRPGRFTLGKKPIPIVCPRTGVDACGKCRPLRRNGIVTSDDEGGAGTNCYA